MYAYSCPTCKNADHLEVVVTKWAKVSCNESGEVETLSDEAQDCSDDWDSSSMMICRCCQREAPAGEFYDVEPDEPLKNLTPDGLLIGTSSTPEKSESFDSDLFENYTAQPPELAAICKKYEDEDDDYRVLELFLAEVRVIGYTFEYGLDAQPYGLRLMTEEEKNGLSERNYINK